MVFHLFVDAVRRRWRVGAFAVFQLYIIVKFLLKLWPASEGVAWAMAGAWFLTIGAGELFRLRELYQLPVSRRVWWRAGWWVSMTASVLIAQVAVTLAYWSARSQWPSVDHIVLSMVLAVLGCGSALALQATSVWRSADTAVTWASTLVFLPVLIGFSAAPFVLASYLPHSFAEIQATEVIVMLAMAAFTLRGYLHLPAIEARGNMRRARPIPSPAVPSGPDGVAAAPAGFAGRLTGLKLVLWEECRKQLIVFSSLIAIGVACWAIASRFRPVLALVEVLRLASVLPFTSASAMISEPIIYGAFVAVAAVMIEPGMVANIRSLRTLPMSSARLACIPAGLGLISATMLWTVLLAVHGLATRTLPASLRPDLFVAFAAFAASAHTIRFLAPGALVGKSMLGFVPVAIVWLALGFSDSWRTDVVQPAMFIGGLVMLAATWLTMRRAVIRSSAIYKLRPAAVRMGG